MDFSGVIISFPKNVETEMLLHLRKFIQCRNTRLSDLLAESHMTFCITTLNRKESVIYQDKMIVKINMPCKKTQFRIEFLCQ